MTAAVALAFAAAPAQAATNPIIDWGPDCHGWNPSSDGHESANGDVITVVGVIDLFQDPLDDLDPVTTEYTVAMVDLVSQGTITTVIPGFGTFYATDYAGGRITIYESPAADAAFGINPPNATSPSTFQNGVVILTGYFTSFHTDTSTLSSTGAYEGNITWDGGTRLADMSGRPGLTTGGWAVDFFDSPAGYDFHVDGKIDLDGPTAVERSNWGTIKAHHK
jgi:hypothetical protein